jgi:hypothetical protein
MSKAAPTYSKTRLGSDQIDGSLSLSPRGKRIGCLVVALVIAAGAAVAIWSGLSHDDLAGSANGCVNVTIPSATGGGTLHYCGSKAETFCRNSFANADPVSLLARPQCDDAGLTRAKVGRYRP